MTQLSTHTEGAIRLLSRYWDGWQGYPKGPDGIYLQTREERQEELIFAARTVASEETKNPYLKQDEREAIEGYAFRGVRSTISDAFILAQKQRIYDKAFPDMRKTGAEWVEFFATVESHVPEKIKAYAIAQGHFAGVDCHAPLFADAWREYGERCKREATHTEGAEG